MKQAILITLLTTVSVFGQWPTSPDTNLVICDRTGEQTIPKVRATPDGGCYVSWYDNSTGNYDMYLQRLNASGVPQWPANGMLISSHPQETWLTDYDLAVDVDGSAVLVFNDIRAGGDWDIYGYLIAPNGQFMWGPDGFALSDNANFEAVPRVCVTPGNFYAFTWIEDTDSGTVVHVRELTDVATDVFPEIILTAQYGCTNPRIVASDSEAVILQYLEPQGTQYWQPRHIYAQKFDHSGNAMWTAGGVPIQTTNGVGVQMLPDLVSEGGGGAISYWYDTRDNNRHHVYVQYIRSNGTVAFTPNGVQTVMAADQLQMSPTLAFVPNLGRVMLFYMTADLNQNNWGIGGQAIDSSGNLLWGRDGISFMGLDPTQRFGLLAFPASFGATVVYLEANGGMNDFVKAMGVNAEGGLEWENSPRMMCSVNSSKLHLDACENHWGQVIAAWGDGRATGDDIYVQNINPDGTLGPYGPPPPTIRITAPPDSTIVFGIMPDIVFDVGNFVVADTGGDGILQMRFRRLGIEDTLYFMSEAPIHVQVGWLSGYFTSFFLELVHYDHSALSPRAVDSVHLAIETPADELPLGLPDKFALLPAYPNPFNAQTTLTLTVPREGLVTVRVYDVLGREAAVLLNERLTVGVHRIAFAAGNLPSGVYLCRMTAGDFVAVQKIILLK